MTLKKQIRGITPKKILLGKQEYEYESASSNMYTATNVYAKIRMVLSNRNLVCKRIKDTPNDTQKVKTAEMVNN